ncbi:peptidoglycan editing factor PgeF [Ramlibacter alkalitolerans]|uniref:Purine nucleoside phosphorylase n=1 Tax=Ramlibacter alkalitolerans TaxID=2039631 RepID=A0ABS1JWT9_9BURK|nr:peptidoglycan editing factor PgeF [Ramlibacter alkalitolerans]MBL0428783.1 peptidoglycan editing factor PgeF [Ramlibacter alkalitolerans]
MTPDWPAPAGVGAFCSERGGGVSAPPYDTLNLGDHVGDDEAAVQENRRRFAATLQARPVFLRQVHGQGVVRLDATTRDTTEADACWTTERGLACTMMVADCLPVLLADRRGAVVGAAHCGWRGLAGGVLEALWAQMAPTAGAAQGMLAWLGPCIGPQAFEVGPEVRAAFVAHDAAAAGLFRPHADGKFLADLPALARRRLSALGITALHGNDGTPAWCTVANPSRFFSHRRDRVSGRFAASVWRV